MTGKKGFLFGVIIYTVCFLLCTPVFAQHSLTIGEIKIEGNWTIETPTIRSHIKTQPGDEFNPLKLRQDLEAIYNTGFFRDVKIDVAEVAGQVQVTFIVLEKPAIKEIEITGYDELDLDKIKEKMEVKENSIFDEAAVARSVQQIKKLYEEQGYYLAEVKVDPEQVSDHWIKLKIDITEGPEVKIRKISFEGNNTFPDDKLKDAIETKEYWFFSWITGSGHLNRETINIDLERLLAFYYENGYIDAQIGAPQIDLNEDRTGLYIKIPISEGVQYNVGKLTVEGNQILTTDEIMPGLLTKEGDVFSSSRLRKDINLITDKYANRGYLLTEVYPLTNSHPETKSVDLMIKINEGKLVYARRIILSGNQSTRDKVIRRELIFKEGDVLTSWAIKRSQQEINKLGFFESVELKNIPTPVENELDIEVDLKERLTGSLSVGAGWSSVDRFIGNVSITQGNLFGRGQRLHLSGTFGETSQRYDIGFTEPWLFDIPLNAGFDIYYRTRGQVEYRDYNIDNQGGQVSFSYPLIESIRGYLSYMYEDVTVYNIDVSAPEIIQEREGTTNTSEVTLALLRDTRDNRWRPSQGSRTKVSIEYAGGILGGDNYYIRYLGEASLHFPLWWKLVFSLHGLIGYETSYDGHEIPVEELFTVGGAQTVRGFKRDSIGPVVDGQVIGGNKELVFNAELHFPIIEPLTGLIFFDTGGAFADDQNYELNQMRMGAGVGIRFFTPMGPIRLDWGHKLDKKEGESDSEWHFAIGTYF
jgi:outer membrane protein insertion porin family